MIDPDVEAALSSISVSVGESGCDQWGFSPKAAMTYFTLGKHIASYFRPEFHGLENLPQGRVLVTPNHSGQLPFDGLVISIAALLHANPPRLLRGMAERWFPTLPFVNIAFSRSGTVVGDPINCRNLLEADNAILVFPEGARGSGKPFSRRYRLESFGRGFMRLALQTNSPVVPVGVVGAEESIISLTDLKPLAKLIKAPYVPVPALLPLLGPLAYLPMPTKFYIYFGKPMTFEGPFDDEDHVIQQKVSKVEDAIRELIAQGREARGESWF